MSLWHRRASHLVALFSAAAWLFSNSPSFAQQSELPNPSAETGFIARPVPFEDALTALANQQKKAQGKAQSGAALLLATPSAEIVALTRALKNDPDLIYQFVHDNIDYTPLYGSLKGPLGTLLDLRGNAFDQASLMVALLQQAALTNTALTDINFQFGQIKLTGPQAMSWLGVDNNGDSLAGVLGSGAIPATVFSTGTNAISSVQMAHVWVKVSINGTAYVFDPAFKAYARKPGIDLAAAMTSAGYTQAGLLTDSQAVVTSTTVQITTAGRTAVRADLVTYANSLATNIRTNYPNAGMADIVGGGTIVPVPMTAGQTVRQTANPNLMPSTTPTDWGTTIPVAYHATLAIGLPGAASQTYNSDDIYGQRLSIFYNSGCTTSCVPTLYNNGTSVVSGTAVASGASTAVSVTITVPWATYANQSRQQSVRAGGAYVIQTGWDQVGRGMIEKHRRTLTQAIAAGSSATSEVVLGESLSVLGYTWLAEAAAQQRLADQILGTTTQYYYGGGIVGQTTVGTVSTPYVDLQLNYINTPARLNGAATQTPKSLAAFLNHNSTGSALESGILEQTQAKTTGFVAASTMKLLDIGAANADTIFDINNAGTAAGRLYYTNTIRPQLVANYTASNLTLLDGYVNANFRVIAPLHGQISVGSWKGVGFVVLKTDGSGNYQLGEIISGGLSGGFGGTNDPAASQTGNTAASQLAGGASPTATPGGLTTPSGWVSFNQSWGDPIDRKSGSFLYQHDDLIAGPLGFPYSLGFQRTYSSAASSIVGPLGKGWTHNFAISAVVGSDGFDGLGQASPLSAVSSIVAIYVSSDLVTGQAMMGTQNVQNFMLQAVVSRWFTDLLTQNIVTVTQVDGTEHFTKLADGTSYASPLGSSTILSKSSNTFRYRRDGITLSFNVAGNISSWTNAAGATVSFGYNASNQLITVSNAVTARTLTLGYTGIQLVSVSDGSGRSVGYGYTSNALTTFTDALLQNTTFTYDSAGRMTKLFLPANPTNPFVTNVYDTFGRVSQQKDANAKTSNVYIAGSRTEMIDPLGSREVWYHDVFGSVLTHVEDFGDSTHFNKTTANVYDGRQRVISTTLPEGNTVAFTYDPLHNPLTITQTAKPGAIDPNTGLAPLPIVQTFTYVKPVTALTNFEKVKLATDGNGKQTTFKYDTTKGNLTEIDQPAVTKPGVTGTVIPKQFFTYTATGLQQTAQDAEGRITRSDYDAVHADQLITGTVDYGASPHLNLVTQFAYDSYGDVSTITDANGHQTSQTYDALRRLTETDAAISNVVTKFGYDPDGNVLSVQRQSNATAPFSYQTTSSTYTLTDLVKTVTDPGGNVVTSAYDSDNRLSTVTSSSGRQVKYGYDLLSRVSTITDLVSGTLDPSITVNLGAVVRETRLYTPNGLLASSKDGKNNITSYVYDGFDRLQKTVYPDTSFDYFQTYDANGNLLGFYPRGGASRIKTFDALNRPLTLSLSATTVAAASSVSYGYDLSSRLLQAKLSTDTVAHILGYDGAGRQVSETRPDGKLVAWKLDAVGNRTELDWPVDATNYKITYSYDALDRMTDVFEGVGTTGFNLGHYSYDLLSNRSGQAFAAPAGGAATITSAFGYTASSDLQQITHNLAGGISVGLDYGYNADHQRNSLQVTDSSYLPSTLTAATVTYTANTLNQYTKLNTTNLTNDGAGNLSYDGTFGYCYDALNRLVQVGSTVTSPTTPCTAGSATVLSTYSYDALDRQSAKVVNSVTTQFVYAGTDMIGEYTAAGAVVNRYVFGPELREPLAVIDTAGNRAFNLLDGLGSTMALADGAGAVTEKHTYTAYGASQSAAGTLYQYAGMRIDAETGLYYDHARYYSPVLGRFLQPDPIGTEDGLNIYTYVANDPAHFTDPSGQFRQIGFDTQRVWNDAKNNPFDTAMGIAEMAACCGGNAEGIESTIMLAGRWAKPFFAAEKAAASSRYGPVIKTYLGPSGPVFGRSFKGGSSFLNINANSVLRIGWGWKGKAGNGNNVFRISGAFIENLGVKGGHIDLITLPGDAFP